MFVCVCVCFACEVGVCFVLHCLHESFLVYFKQLICIVISFVVYSYDIYEMALNSHDSERLCNVVKINI